MRKFGKGIFKLLIILAMVAGSLYIGKEALPLIKENQLGLDLAGGVSITYQSKTPNPEKQQMSDAIYKLQLKSQDYSTEAEVYQEGSDRINIDIPGVTNANEILLELGKPGTLYFVEGDVRFPLLTTPSNVVIDEQNVDGIDNETISIDDLTTKPTTEANEGLPNVSQIADENVHGFSSTEPVDNILGDNVHVEGADIIQNPDGSIQIGGTPQDGATIIQHNEDEHDHENEGESADGDVVIDPNIYDYTAKPEFDMEQVVITGKDINSARAGMTQDNYGKTGYVVDLGFTEEGKQKFAEATERNLYKPIYIIFNGEVVSAPVVQAVIGDGRAQITGMGSMEAADILASTIRIGSLPLELEVLRSNEVGAKLGIDAINTSLKAGLIGFIIVCVFMVIFYLLPGLAASLALAIYLGLTLFLIKQFGITLTLPGIAGIILSLGMAVDANIIIFTRIKEEIGLGKSTRNAVKEGFAKALSAILDGNITTLIAAAVLNMKGTGSIKGFAATLALGIVLSMFTALFITRIILNTFLDLGLDNEKMYGRKVDRQPIGFIGFRRLPYIISLLIIVVGIVFMGINSGNGKGAFNLGLDFQGGSSTSITFNEDLSKEEIEAKVVPIFTDITGSNDIQIQKVSNSNEVIVKTATLAQGELESIYAALEDENGYAVIPSNITTENISGAFSSKMRQDAIIAVIISTILMLIYIWFRFKDIRFAGAAVIALIHDCIVTVAFYAVFRWTVDSTFIACMLTIVGYSINDTIVIFDRIREDLGKLRGAPIEVIVNTAITQTFTRSVNTSITTLITVIVLYIIGVASIKAFALPLIIGIVCGCYSSVCITGAMWFDFKKIGVKK